MKKSVYFSSTLLLTVVLLACACGQSGSNKKNDDTATSGHIYIAADESIRPIIEAQEAVFESIYPKAHIDIIYTNEFNAIKLLADDSVRLAIVTRDMYADEQAPMDAIKIRPRYSPVAYDAIAIILNQENHDTVFTIEQLANILNGTYTHWNQLNPAYSSKSINVVFDSPKSGAVRMLRDSLLKGGELGKQCFAVHSNRDVIDYVANNKDALGIIGVAWISDRDDSTSNSFIKRIRVAELVPHNPETAEASTMKPYQAYIALKQYPLWRKVQIISREARVGLGTGFASFVASDRGQRIVLKSGLVPALAPVRIVQLNSN
ncbi:MAG: PstS family phosphate ABC transporter substrate-binding protein [Bacteroidota bacterium]|jgi:phosphate transport system substrate-binding protein